MLLVRLMDPRNILLFLSPREGASSTYTVPHVRQRRRYCLRLLEYIENAYAPFQVSPLLVGWKDRCQAAGTAWPKGLETRKLENQVHLGLVSNTI